MPNILYDIGHASIATIRKCPVGITDGNGENVVFVVCLFGLSTTTSHRRGSSRYGRIPDDHTTGTIRDHQIVNIAGP